MKTYKGKLNQPIHGRRLGLLSDPAIEWDRIVEARAQKLPALFEVHNLPYGDWHGLALALAIAHVPGFAVTKNEGRPAKWDDFTRALFWLAVQEMRAQRLDETLNQSIRRAARLKDFRELAGGMKDKALERQYRLCSRWGKVGQKAMMFSGYTHWHQLRDERNSSGIEPG